MTGRQYDISPPYDRDMLAMRVDDDGELMWTRQFDDREHQANVTRCNSAVQLEDGGFGLVGPGTGGQGLVIRLDEDGNTKWEHHYNSVRSFDTVLLHPDGSMIACGSYTFGGISGLLMKIVPESSAPQIINYIPEALEIDLLMGDSLLFAVEAVDLQEDELFFTWTVGDDTVSTDTTTTIVFDELGDIAVKCHVSDGELADSVQWLIHVGEFLIETYSPDSLAWTVRRPYDADFSLGIRAIEDVEPQYRWILTDREHREVDVGNEAELTYTFDIQGNYRLEGRAFHNGAEKSVQWQVVVNSVLYWWRPHVRQLEANVRQEIEFSVIPFNGSATIHLTISGS